MVTADIILIAIAIPLVVWCVWEDIINSMRGGNND